MGFEGLDVNLAIGQRPKIGMQFQLGPVLAFDLFVLLPYLLSSRYFFRRQLLKA